MSDQSISADFPFKSKYINVSGSEIHYVDEGEGDPILFLHGNPTSSYLWRNVIPHLSSVGRCIAPDLIGMGKSDKPDIDYRFFDHACFVEGFIEKLGLKNITLVIHDWGSALGFYYAMRHEENVRGIAFMEAIVRPSKWKEFPTGFRLGFKMFRTPGIGWLMISGMNMFIKKLLPSAIVRKLTEQEKAHYAAPYPRFKDRKPVWRWPNEIPIDGKPADVHKAIEDYGRWLTKSELPKLLFYGDPGGIIDKKGVVRLKASLSNLRTVDIGQGIHYLQEDNPHLIGEELKSWVETL